MQKNRANKSSDLTITQRLKLIFLKKYLLAFHTNRVSAQIFQILL